MLQRRLACVLASGNFSFQPCDLLFQLWAHQFASQPKQVHISMSTWGEQTSSTTFRTNLVMHAYHTFETFFAASSY